MSKKKEQKSLVHIDEYLTSRGDIRSEVKAGFKVFMRGRGYQYSFQDFDNALEEYFNRKI